ncbi:unnamed protein product [Lactuca virosa]|uniref:Uncharacterized protein n=1 Tax=Lactuca virosa TaxID=75947 RepID=A0AAU9NHK0_9ASTR|nr:unnamed protein product [Lactuca virosa]
MLPPLLPTPTTPQFTNNPPPPLNSKTHTTRRTLSPAEFVDKRSKALCFFCDEKFERGHVCKGKKSQLYHLEFEEEDEEEMVEEETEINTELAHISLNAISGISSFQTMRLTGMSRKKQLQLLLDGGSTHNFIDKEVAILLNCSIHTGQDMKVKIPGGGQLACNEIVKDFCWTIQGMEFKADVYLVPLGGCDMVLGVQWLSTLGPILCDFKHLTMQFNYQGKKMVLRGSKSPKLSIIKAQQLGKLMHTHGSLAMMQLRAMGESIPNYQMNTTPPSKNQKLPLELQLLVSKYSCVFVEPTTLPPSRQEFDHRIPLKEGSSWNSDEGLQLLIKNKEDNSGSHKRYSWQGGELRRKGKLVVGNVPDLRNRLIKWHHTLAQGGHSGVTATYKRLTRLFY